MRRLLYCVLRVPCAGRLRGLRGVDGRPVRVVVQQGLGAAVSVLPDEPLVATVERVETYERVVEAYFAEQAVVPMRFGSVLDTAEEIAAFLDERGPGFRDQLRELEGSVEMGLRVLRLPELSARTSSEAARPTVVRPPAPPGSGRAYLESRARGLPAGPNPVERYRRAFQGLFTRLEVELPAPLRLIVGADGRFGLAPGGAATDAGVAAARKGGAGALNLAFLVPRDNVEQFRAAFARLPEKASCRLSGPWPPYSFVAR